MKKFLALLFLVLLALPAGAAVKEFDGFTIDVPRGWTAEAEDGDVYVADKDETAMLAITYIGKADDKQFNEVVNEFVSSNEIDQSKVTGYPGGYAMPVDMDGEEGTAYIFRRGGVLFMVASFGGAPALGRILDSLTPTEREEEDEGDRGAGGQQGTPTLLELSTPT